MKTKIPSTVKKLAWLLTLVYFASYLMRINYAVMMLNVGSEMGVDKTALAVVVTALTVTYGSGQVISGLMGEKIPSQLMLSMGLGLAVLSNVAMFFMPTIPAMTAVWAVNGFAHSMLWPPIVKIMSTTMIGDEYGYTSVRVSWGSSIATILLYLGCPLLLNVMNWRQVMLVTAGMGALILLAWIIFSPKLMKATAARKDSPTVISGGKIQKSPLPKFVFLPIICIMLAICLQGILRDGVTNWMPFYLLETFHLPEDKAIIATVILAVFSIVSFAASDFLHRKFFRNEVFCAAMMFVLSTVSSLVLFFVNGHSMVASMLLMAIVVACMHGANLMLISVVPKRFLKSGRVSTFSGLFNCFTYIGAAIGSYGFAFLQENYSWDVTIFSWVIVSLLSVGVLLIATRPWEKFRKSYAHGKTEEVSPEIPQENQE